MNYYLWEWIIVITLFRQCTIEDLDILQPFSRQRYFETFSDMNTPENMTAYLDEAFALEKIRAELSDANAAFYFLYWDGKLAGYLKLNEAPAQTDLHDEQSLEIERIYVSEEFQGEGLGRYLMDQAISIAIQRKKKYVWLGVWEKNEKALRFYRRNGFYQIGTHSFVMGDDKQTDYIMRKDLEK
ncbi:GNAT family N-acetyltransferase [Anaerotruncus colihominis]|uniref:GNAT family N-acetyltransferase n=1 Tax=Anaerotruncus colihominis TaxID=169435 RepID=UPI0018A99A9C|nr:GNAT family N-acetyltransferase [Anaerotruncus colihominis]